MNKENVSQIISHIDDEYIDEATVFAFNNNEEPDRNTFSEPKIRNIKRLRRVAVAICLALIAAIGSAAFLITADAREYNTAMAFFEKNGLSAEGLSRSEVKAVYRDITTKSFTNIKTAEVIQRAVCGWEIPQDEPTPEELAAIWDRNVWRNAVTSGGISFRNEAVNIHDSAKGIDVLDKSILECYQDGVLLWSAEFSNSYIEGYSYTQDATAVWGQSENWSSQETSHCWFALVDDKGNYIHQQYLHHGFSSEHVASVLNNGDGTWAVISRGELKYLCLSLYDPDGNELSFHKTEVGNLGIWNAARLGDGYIVQLGNLMSEDTALLYWMDHDGNVTASNSYESDDCEYYLTDMIEFGGQIYLSAYAVPRQNDKSGRREIAGVLSYVFSEFEKHGGDWEITSEELTPLVRDNYTALLLICDPDGGAPKTFYSVEGSLAGRLSVNDSAELKWNVESITSTFFSIATSSFTIGGTCNVFCYSFDASGNLTGQTDTGETVPYRR